MAIFTLGAIALGTAVIGGGAYLLGQSQNRAFAREQMARQDADKAETNAFLQSFMERQEQQRAAQMQMLSTMMPPGFNEYAAQFGYTGQAQSQPAAGQNLTPSALMAASRPGTFPAIYSPAQQRPV